MNKGCLVVTLELSLGRPSRRQPSNAEAALQRGQSKATFQKFSLVGYNCDLGSECVTLRYEVEQKAEVFHIYRTMDLILQAGVCQRARHYLYHKSQEML